MAKKILYCTLDTETVGGAANPIGMYNVGIIIHDNIGNIYAKQSLLIMEHYEEIKEDDYAKKNFNLYLNKIKKGDISSLTTEEEAYNAVYNLCKFYNVKYIMAYNTGFDFVKTIFKSLLDDFEFIDIYLMALQTVTHLKKYQNFCIKNKLFSASKKSCSTTAQTVYAYFTNNPQYQEEHTALEDAKIEMEIFINLYKMHKKFTKNIHMWDCKENKNFPKIY